MSDEFDAWLESDDPTIPASLKRFTVDYICAIMAPADGTLLPTPPSSFADDTRAWFFVHWTMTRWTAHLIETQTGEAGHAGDWYMEMVRTDEDGNEVAAANPDDAPPQIALASRLVTCALNNDIGMAIALAKARWDVATDAFFEIAMLLHQIAAHGTDASEGWGWDV
jgi:hypothetical protein